MFIQSSVSSYRYLCIYIHMHLYNVMSCIEYIERAREIDILITFSFPRIRSLEFFSFWHLDAFFAMYAEAGAYGRAGLPCRGSGSLSPKGPKYPST